MKPLPPLLPPLHPPSSLAWHHRSSSFPPLDREEEAHNVLCRLRRVPESDPRIRLELLEIKAVSMFEQETRAAKYPDVNGKIQVALQEYKDLFVLPHLNRRLLIACMLQFLQQFTGTFPQLGSSKLLIRIGINAVIYYAPIMFRSVCCLTLCHPTINTC